MSNFTSSIKIENFKSIKSLELGDCRRINLFIGRPNVGKSNILEALSLFSLTYLAFSERNLNLRNFIRIGQFSELFFDGNTTFFSKITLNDDTWGVSINDLNQTIGIHFQSATENIVFNNKLDFNFPPIRLNDEALEKPYQGSYPYKSYFFPKEMEFVQLKRVCPFLFPFRGDNLYNVVQSNQLLKEEVLSLFKDYNLHLVFDKSSQELKVMKGLEQGEIFLIPFSSIADSLQRLIFYKAAIKSNTDSVITFEEPEAHTYPPYIAQIAQDIIESKTNQFFITTHSPYVVNEMLENAQDELAIYLVDLKDGQTVAKRLSDNELDEIYNAGIDLFFNEEFFI